MQTWQAPKRRPTRESCRPISKGHQRTNINKCFHQKWSVPSHDEKNVQRHRWCLERANKKFSLRRFQSKDASRRSQGFKLSSNLGLGMQSALKNSICLQTIQNQLVLHQQIRGRSQKVNLSTFCWHAYPNKTMQIIPILSVTSWALEVFLRVDQQIWEFSSFWNVKK